MARAIGEHVIPVQVDTQDAANQPIVERFQQVWTPTIMLLSPEGQIYHEWNGYLPPPFYLPQLLLRLGKAGLKQHREDEAARYFDAVGSQYPTSDAAPEAAYWAAVARYKSSHKPEDLLGGWQRLQSQYPDSPWRVKQSFIEQK